MKLNKSGLIIYVLCILELIVFFVLANNLHFIISPLLILLIGVVIAFYPLYNKPNEAVISIEKLNKKHRIIAWLGIVCLFILFVLWANTLYLKMPIDVKCSDIIPCIQVFYVERFVRGEFVYTPVPFQDGSGMFTPNYLPAHWFPFVIARKFYFDYRWVALLVYYVGVIIYSYFILKAKKIKLNTLFKLLLPFILLFFILKFEEATFSCTVEIMIVGYYLILSTFLMQQSTVGIGLGLTLTILSRYAVLFYLPVAVVIGWVGKRKQLFLITVITAVIILLCYVIPFLSKNWSMFSDSQIAYRKAAIGEWNGQSWQALGDRPCQLFKGFGFASWVYLISRDTLIAKISYLQNLFFIVLICIIGILTFINYKKQKTVNHSFLQLASLKIILLVCFSFVSVPYSYLFWSSFAISIVIVSQYNVINKQED